MDNAERGEDKDLNAPRAWRFVPIVYSLIRGLVGFILGGVVGYIVSPAALLVLLAVIGHQARRHWLRACLTWLLWTVPLWV
ncbi:MAG: hypothetical protein JO316_01230 [Abitibacteriaceae bacterium]|nr:hypothetical protein [Abditibacteriaceae bacterium]